MGLMLKIARYLKSKVSEVRSQRPWRQSLGLPGYLIYRYRLRQLRLNPNLTKELTFASKYLKYPVYCRSHTTDVEVFKELFVRREYECLDWVKSASFIIDCGANVGYSSAYFMTRFPNAKLVAVEPDPSNFELLQKNVRPYGDRCRLINAAVWPEKANLSFDPTPYRGGGEWARVVRQDPVPTTDSITAVTIPEVLADSGFRRISLLKIDIEKSELPLFRSPIRNWLGQVDTIVIELHDQECREAFQDAIKEYRFSCSDHGWLTVARNLDVFESHI